MIVIAMAPAAQLDQHMGTGSRRMLARRRLKRHRDEAAWNRGKVRRLALAHQLPPAVHDVGVDAVAERHLRHRDTRCFAFGKNLCLNRLVVSSRLAGLSLAIVSTF